MSAPVAVTTGTFESEVLKSAVPVLVDFWAPWCGPCRMVAPVLDAVAAEYGGKVKVVKVNVDEQPALADRYGILGIPTLLLFRDGQMLHQQVGYVPKNRLTQILDQQQIKV